MNEQLEVYRAAVAIMAALIQSGEMKAYSDRNRESYNKYCVEKAKALYKDLNYANNPGTDRC